MPISLSEHHPQYDEQSYNWVLMRDCYKGQKAVKEKRYLYLPATSGQVADGIKTSNQLGYMAYAAYIMRARFPGFTREAVQTAVGMLHSQPAKIDLPPEMEGMRSSEGETLTDLLRRINEEQLITGRVGLLADLPSSGGTLPYIATYSAETIINWDTGNAVDLIPRELQLVVLDETGNVRRDDSLGWQTQEKYRVLALQDGVYKVGVFETRNGSLDNLITPSHRGNTLDKIPFVIINSCDLVATVDEPPLLDLAELCLTIYRGEADYRQNLFMQGQDTLVIEGGVQDETETVRTGAGSRIDVPQGGDAKYIGVQSDGLSEQREALTQDRLRAGSMGAQSLDTVSRERESGSSLNIRIAARTADLNQVALAGAKGLENILRRCATWIGANPELVVVTPNLEFGDTLITGQTMVEQQTARNLGYPVSARSLHQVAFDKGLTKLTFEEELAQAESEEDTVFGKMDTADRNPQQAGANATRT